MKIWRKKEKKACGMHRPSIDQPFERRMFMWYNLSFCLCFCTTICSHLVRLFFFFFNLFSTFSLIVFHSIFFLRLVNLNEKKGYKQMKCTFSDVSKMIISSTNFRYCLFNAFSFLILSFFVSDEFFFWIINSFLFFSIRI